MQFGYEAFVGVAGDSGIERNHALGSVQHETDDMGHADVAARRGDAPCLGHVAGLALAAYAGRVGDRAEVPALSVIGV